MDICGIGIGFVISVVCWYAVSLSSFIKNAESGEPCRQCSRFEHCFAMRDTRHGTSNCLSDWMLISYLAVNKKCPYSKKNTFFDGIVASIFGFLLFFILFWSKGMNFSGLIMGITAIVLLFLAIVDWNTQYIPFECNIFIFICGLIHLFADFSNWLEYLIGLIAVSGFLFIVNRIGTPILRKKYPEEEEIDSVIGDGDIKLMAATGLLLGWKLNFIALGIGCISGSVIHLIRMKIKGSGAKLALGPYLSLGVYITMICGEQLVSWYLNMLGLYPV